MLILNFELRFKSVAGVVTAMDGRWRVVGEGPASLAGSSPSACRCSSIVVQLDYGEVARPHFHKPIYHRNFSMTVLLKVIYGQDTYSVMYFGVCLTSWHLCPAPGGRPRHVMRRP